MGGVTYGSSELKVIEDFVIREMKRRKRTYSTGTQIYKSSVADCDHALGALAAVRTMLQSGLAQGSLI
jgi:hypothetical protein